jgi:hypothetical protein
MTARKHDGFRILARKDGNPVKLITRNGYDFADRFPLIVDGIAMPLRLVPQPYSTRCTTGALGLLVFNQVSDCPAR